MTKVAIIGTGPCGLSMLRAFEQAEKKGEQTLFIILINLKLVIKIKQMIKFQKIVLTM